MTIELSVRVVVAVTTADLAGRILELCLRCKRLPHECCDMMYGTRTEHADLQAGNCQPQTRYLENTRETTSVESCV